jgi:hypothetical protein
MTQAPSLQRPGDPVATETRLVLRLVAGGYDWLFDHVDPCGGQAVTAVIASAAARRPWLWRARAFARQRGSSRLAPRGDRQPGWCPSRTRAASAARCAAGAVW